MPFRSLRSEVQVLQQPSPYASSPLHPRRDEALELESVPSFFFSGPTRTVVAHDDGAAITGTLAAREQLIERAEAALRSGGPEAERMVMGAVPFTLDMPVQLFCPKHVTRKGRWWLGTAQEAQDHARRRQTLTLLSNRTDDGARFTASVRNAVAAMKRGELRKVVLARCEEYGLNEELEVPRLLRSLRLRNPHGFIFAMSLGARSSTGPCTLLGASPELLLSRRGRRVVSAPLAGSIARAGSASEDARRVERLLASPKERHEHRLVVEEIVENLRPFMRELRWEREPVVTSTPAMWHLATRIEGSLRDLDVSSLRLALALHPTPAVCGLPVARAAEFIARAERFERGYFTGTLGHMDASGDGDWIVTIRCAELARGRVRVFAGAGIVESSVAEAELAETEAKMRTMLDVLGAEAGHEYA